MIRKVVYIVGIVWYLLLANTTFAYTHADTLRGSNGRGRDWWDVMRYDLQLGIDTTFKSIYGTNQVFFRVTKTPHDSMQIDLHRPLVIDSVIMAAPDTNFREERLSFANDGRAGNVWWIKHPFHKLKTGNLYSITIYYHGLPQAAQNPPWDGGFSWEEDNNGNLWASVSCQGLGASVWWPCKDAQWDEPDSGMAMSFITPGLFIVSNGRPVNADSTWFTGKPPAISSWIVKNPINTYDVTFYMGDYVHWHDTLMGEKGVLDLDFYVLRYNEAIARKQFEVVKSMIHCFEYWMGPYPFYEDGYKLVEAPYLGMEHQSAIAYGNKYLMGYRGTDRTTSGYGLKFDYIIIHESGHEWFGNSITAKDIADNWIHEGITTFSESLFAECLLGKDKGKEYCRTEWHNILNDKPVIGSYGVNNEGSNDMYDKGAAIMYMIRTMTNDDEKFRQMLRGLSKDFYHQVVTTKQVEDYISEHTGLNLNAFFNQYLRTANVPELEYYIKDGELSYRFNKVVEGFTVPIRVKAGETKTSINPTKDWQHIKWAGGFDIDFSDDFLIKVKE